MDERFDAPSKRVEELNTLVGSFSNCQRFLILGKLNAVCETQFRCDDSQPFF